MPRVSKSSRYTEKKSKAVKELNKVEIEEKIEQKKSELHEVQDNMTIHANNTGEHNPRELQGKSARYTELKQIRDTVTEDISSLNSQLNSINNSQPEKRDSVLNAGISITDNPFDENRRETTPITAQGNEEGWSISDNPNFITGQNSFSFDGSDDREILSRRQGRSQNSMSTVVNPMLSPRLQVAGREPQLTNEEYQRYTEEERRVLHNEDLVARQIQNDRLAQHRSLTPTQYANAESQGSNPITETVNLLNQTAMGFEKISSDGVNQNDFGQANNPVDRLQNAFLSNLSLAVINPTRPTSTFNQKKETTKPKTIRVEHEDDLPRVRDTVSNTEMQAGLVVQGMAQSFGSYSNMISNAYNFATGKEQVAMKERDMPVQDIAVSGLIKSFQDSQSFNVPFSVALQDNYQNYQKKNVPLAKQAGNLAVEGLIMALPIPLFAIGKVATQAVKHGSKLGDSFASRMSSMAFSISGVKKLKKLQK